MNEFTFDLQRFTLSNSQGEDAVFSIVNSSGSTLFGASSDFTNDTLSGATSIVLLKDLTMEQAVTLPAGATVNDNVTFDLGGHSLTYSATGNTPALTIANSASVTITNGTINYTVTSATDDSPAIKVGNGATLNLCSESNTENNTLKVSSAGPSSIGVFIGGGSLFVNSGATIEQAMNGTYAIVYDYTPSNNTWNPYVPTVTSHCTINGGKVISHSNETNPSYGCIFFAGASSTFSMSGGEVTYDGTSYCAITTDSLRNGTFEMSGGTIQNTYDATNADTVEMHNMSSAVISGGKIYSQYGLALLSYTTNTTIKGSATIEGGFAAIVNHYNGTFKGNTTIEENAVITGGNYGIWNCDNSDFTINGGTIIGKTAAIRQKHWQGTNNVTGKVVVNGGTLVSNGEYQIYSDKSKGFSIAAASGMLLASNVGGASYFFIGKDGWNNAASSTTPKNGTISPTAATRQAKSSSK